MVVSDSGLRIMLFSRGRGVLWLNQAKMAKSSRMLCRFNMRLLLFRILRLDRRGSSKNRYTCHFGAMGLIGVPMGQPFVDLGPFGGSRHMWSGRLIPRISEFVMNCVFLSA